MEVVAVPVALAIALAVVVVEAVVVGVPRTVEVDHPFDRTHWERSQKAVVNLPY